MQPVRTIADLHAMMTAAKAVAVVAAWNERGLMKQLAEGPVAIADLDASPRSLATTIPVLMHLGLLVGDGERVALSAVGRRMLEEPELPGAQSLEWLRDLSTMADVVARGGPVLDERGASKATLGGTKPDDKERTRRFLDMLYRRSEVSAEQVFTWLAPRLPEGAHLLDLGGGHGRYARRFADGGFRATLFDQPMVVELARERHADRLAYRGGDFGTDALGGPYDAALLSNIVHGEPPEANARLVRRVAEALGPGGWLCLKDMWIDAQGDNPEIAVMFGITMLNYTPAGQSYTVAQAARWCRGAGLSEPELVTLDSFALLLARKVGAGSDPGGESA